MTVLIVEYQWSGKKLFWEIKSHCEECDITKSMIENMMQKEFKGKDVTFEIKPWLDNLFYCLFRFSWHAPITMVNGKKFHQFSEDDPIVNREKLAEHVLDQLE